MSKWAAHLREDVPQLAFLYEFGTSGLYTAPGSSPGTRRKRRLIIKIGLFFFVESRRETGAAVNPQFPTKPSNLTRKRQTFILNIIFGHSLNPLFYAGSSAIGPYYVNKFLHILQTVVCTPQIAHILKLLQGTQRRVDLIKLTRIKWNTKTTFFTKPFGESF